MSTDEYTPNENQARAYYATTRNDEEGVSIPEAFEEWSRFLARVRRDAQKDILTTARAALAGEDTVEWARGAHSSRMSYPYAIGIMDDLIEELDEEDTP